MNYSTGTQHLGDNVRLDRLDTVLATVESRNNYTVSRRPRHKQGSLSQQMCQDNLLIRAEAFPLNLIGQ
jgi:hypothetical protein